VNVTSICQFASLFGLMDQRWVHKERTMIQDFKEESELTKAEFDQLCLTSKIVIGPFKESFGSGYGEPYNPYRRVYGNLDGGRFVWAWLRKPNTKRSAE